MLEFILSLIKKKFDYERLYKPFVQYFSLYLRRYNREYYVGLAAVFLLYIAYTIAMAIAGNGFKAKTYDLAIQTRFSSPIPSEEIIILDIDEKSIAHFSETLGRWPWPRETLAEAIAGIEDQNPSAIYLNLLLAEPDLSNENSDAVLQNVLSSYNNIILPWVRLNPKNDVQSKLLVSEVPGFTGNVTNAQVDTVAVIPSMFSDAKNHHGFSNLKEDKDGLIRRFDVIYNFEDGYIPSAALVASRIHLQDANWLPKDQILLNWRNKRSGYKRVSFSDAWADLQRGDADKLGANFKNKIVVLGVSAPGIANLKPTAASPLVDDNVIVATAIDDLVNRSYIRILPQWIDGIISAALIVAFCLSFVVGSYFKKTALIVSTIQGVLASITVGFISYTFFFVDLTQSIGLSLSFLGLCKLHQSLDTRASRAESLFSHVTIKPGFNFYSMIVFNHKKTSDKSIKRFKKQLEINLGANAVFFFDNVFDCSNLLESSLKGLGAFLIFTPKKPEMKDSMFVFINAKDQQKHLLLDDSNKLGFVTHGLDGYERIDQIGFNMLVSKNLLELSLKYLG